MNNGAPALGALAGLLLHDRHGAPVWLLLVVISASLASGLFAASGRSREAAARKEAERMAVRNAAALWFLACGIVWLGNLTMAGAMITALALGLLGTRALVAIEERYLKRME